MSRKRPSSPDPPPHEPYAGYSDKDFDDIYLSSGKCLFLLCDSIIIELIAK